MSDWYLDECASFFLEDWDYYGERLLRKNYRYPLGSWIATTPHKGAKTTPMPILTNALDSKGFRRDKLSLMKEVLGERIREMFPTYVLNLDDSTAIKVDGLSAVKAINIILNHKVTGSTVAALHNAHELFWMNDEELREAVGKALSEQEALYRKTLTQELFTGFITRMTKLGMSGKWRLTPYTALQPVGSYGMMNTQELYLEILASNISKWVKVEQFTDVHAMSDEALKKLIAEKCDAARRDY